MAREVKEIVSSMDLMEVTSKEIIQKLVEENKRLKEENFQLRKLLRAIQFLTKGCLPTELVEELRKK